MEFHFFLSNITQGSFFCFVLFCCCCFRIKKITSTESIIFGSLKRNTIEFNSSNNSRSETIENKELSLPSPLSFFVGRNSICYIQYWVFKKGGNTCTLMVLGTRKSQKVGDIYFSKYLAPSDLVDLQTRRPITDYELKTCSLTDPQAILTHMN